MDQRLRERYRGWLAGSIQDRLPESSPSSTAVSAASSRKNKKDRESSVVNASGCIHCLAVRPTLPPGNRQTACHRITSDCVKRVRTATSVKGTSMLLADIFSIALSIVGFLLSLQGLWMISRALWPTRVRNASLRIHRNSVASFFLGLLIILVVIIVAIVTAKRGGAPGQFFAFALGSAFVVYANVGVAGLATHIGQRLPSPVDSDRPWRATVPRRHSAGTGVPRANRWMARSASDLFYPGSRREHPGVLHVARGCTGV